MRNNIAFENAYTGIEGNAGVEIPASFFFRSVANRSQVLITHAQTFESDACATFWLMSTQDG